MLIDGKKWACEACIRGHRVTSCKHHDRPLIRIKRKGRPFATCTICNATPCTAPIEHARAKRDAELKCPKKPSHARLYPRRNTTGFLPIAPRPDAGSASNEKALSASFKLSSRSGSAQNFSASAPPSRSNSAASSCMIRDVVGAADWSGSEASLSGYEPSNWTVSGRQVLGSKQCLDVVRQESSRANSTSGSWCDYPVIGAEETLAAETLFEPAYSFVPPATVGSESQLVQTLPLVSPLEEVNPFEFPLDPALVLGNGGLNYMGGTEMDLELQAWEEAFHVEDWSRYLWSAETGFEHLDTVLLSLDR